MKRFRAKVKRRPSQARVRRSQPAKELPRIKRPLKRLFWVLLLFAVGCTAPAVHDHPADSLHFPIGVAADPAGDFLYINNTNFDLAYETGTVVALDLNTHRLVPESVVRVPGFGGKMVVHAVPKQDTHLYLPTRVQNALVWITVSRDLDSDSPRLSCNSSAANAEEAQSCGGENVLVLSDSVTAAAECGSAWVKNEKDDSKGLNSGSAFQACEGGGPAGKEPFGATISDRAGDVANLYVGSFGGNLSVFRLSEQGAPYFSKDVDMVIGTYGVAVHPQVEQVYATSKFANVLQSVSVSDQGSTFVPDLNVEKSIVVTNATLGKDFGRGIAFNAAGTRAYVAYRSPPSLLIVDTSLDENGQPANRVLNSVVVGNGPADVVVSPSGPDGRELVYVSAYSVNQIYVVDPQLMLVVDVIDTGKGPFSMAVVKNEERFRLYFSLFEEHLIGVVELDWTSPFYHQEIARVP
ncbi:MAG TPA: YncE family protein [Myxococcales bacterium]|nr:YncE family protein [Myxococcales bacterium]